MGRIYLHEYLGSKRTAQVYKGEDSHYYVEMYQGAVQEECRFDDEQSAEDFAEFWVMQPVSDSTRL